MVANVRTTMINPHYGGSPKKRKKAGAKSKHRPRQSSNPDPFVLTLGAIGANPYKEKKTVAKRKKKKKASPSAKARANNGGRKKGKRKNPGVSMATLKSMLGGKKKKKKAGRRNPPSMFGHVGTKSVLGISAGVLGGVTVAKLIPPMLPAGWTATDLGKFLTTLGVAVVESAIAHYTLSAPFRDAVWAGAGAQTLSVGLNPILRKMSTGITLGRIREKAMGDFVRASFPEPQNPIYNRMIAAGMDSIPGATGQPANIGKYAARW